MTMGSREKVKITLSPMEGERLLALLKELLESGDEERNFSDLDSLLEKVEEANALALWLRENVTAELDGREVVAMQKVLEKTS